MLDLVAPERPRPSQAGDQQQDLSLALLLDVKLRFAYGDQFQDSVTALVLV